MPVGTPTTPIEPSRNPREAKIHANYINGLCCVRPCLFTLFGTCYRGYWLPLLDHTTDLSTYKGTRGYCHFETANAWTHLVGAIVVFIYFVVRMAVFGERTNSTTEVFHVVSVLSFSVTFMVSTFYHSFTPYQSLGALWRTIDITFVYGAVACQLLAEVQVSCYSRGGDSIDISLTIADVAIPVVSTAIFFVFVLQETPGRVSQITKGVVGTGADAKYSSRRLYHSGGMFSMTRVSTSFTIIISYLLTLGRMLSVELVPGSFDTQLFVVWSNIGGILLLMATTALDYSGFPDDYRTYRCTGSIQCILQSNPIRYIDAHFLWHVATLVAAIWGIYSRERILCYLRKDANPHAFETDPYLAFCESVFNRTSA